MMYSNCTKQGTNNQGTKYRKHHITVSKVHVFILRSTALKWKLSLPQHYPKVKKANIILLEVINLNISSLKGVFSETDLDRGFGQHATEV
jgi:hypothetical protein